MKDIARHSSMEGAKLASDLKSGAVLAPSLQSADQTDYAGTAELWANEKHLQNYNEDIVRKLAAAAPSAAAVLEFGAGIGTLAQLWQLINRIKPECLEIDANLRAILAERHFHCYADLEAVDHTFDTIYTSNVLEHIDDDVATLRQLHAILKPGGHLAIYVPAFMCLYSEMDQAIGHYRRYEKKELTAKVRQAGFDIEECCYADSIGFFAWFAMKLKGYKADQPLGSGASLKIYDRYIFPLSKILDKCGFKFLFGKNLLLIAKKRD